MSRQSNGCFRCPNERKPCRDKRHKCKLCNGLGITADYKLCDCSKAKGKRKASPEITLDFNEPGRNVPHNRRRRRILAARK